jgi:hypothetical protein
MPAKSINCRHCGEGFVPQPGKPGFRDECPECLHAKTTPRKSSQARAAELIELVSNPKTAKPAFRLLKKQLLDLGMSESAVDKFIVSALEVGAGLRKLEDLNK